MVEKLLDIPKAQLFFTAQGRNFSYDKVPEKRLSDFQIQENTSIFFIKRFLGGEQSNRR